mgnify:CR=1 FL=1
MSHTTKKVVVLVGSLRQASYHRMIANTLAELAPANMTIEILPSIGDIPHYDSDVQTAGFPASVSALGAAIKAADGVIIVTPEYNYSIPGVLKNAIDWLSRLPEPPFAGKALAIQSASMGALGGSRVQYHLRQTLVFLDAMVLNKPEIMVGTIQNKVDAASGKVTDADTRTYISKQLVALDALIEKLAA